MKKKDKKKRLKKRREKQEQNQKRSVKNEIEKKESDSGVQNPILASVGFMKKVIEGDTDD